MLHPHEFAVRLDLPERAKHMHPVLHVSAMRRYRSSEHAPPAPLPDCIHGEFEREVDYIEKRMEK
jgi:hypothetical protein